MTLKGTVTLETATFDDCPMLAEMNRQLIVEGRQSNAMTIAELSERMCEWFQKGVYTGYVFRLNGATIGYSLVDLTGHPPWVRHFFICREYRRQGYGRTAVGLLFEKLVVEEIGLSCLTENAPGQAFWRSFNHDAYSVKFNIRKPNDKESTSNGIRLMGIRDYADVYSLPAGLRPIPT
jgi:predicted acetyltransferase